MAIQFQRLLDVCKATEELPLGGFRMEVISCGTAGCMIGNYAEMFGQKHCRINESNFGITPHEWTWLFDSRIADCEPSPSIRRLLCRRLEDVTQAQALARLRKFIYYKLHKHEMIHDEKYGVREEARTKEGDHYFAKRAVESAASCAAV